MSSRQRIIIITGPTATGKSNLGVMLAKEIDGEIISADSMQVYKNMDIGTAKLTKEEMCGVSHHLIDFISPLDDYSVARYVADAAICISDIIKRGKQPIIVGGTGLYIDSLIKGRGFLARGDNNLRKDLENEFNLVGGEAMLKKLHDVDAESAAKLHSNDKKRIVRALESFYTTGKTISQHDIESKTLLPKYDAIKFSLNFTQRDELYSRIDKRVDNMIKSGLENEVFALKEMGVTCNNTSMQAIGYKEIFGALTNGESIQSVVETIKMESRRYAKRQLTWLRRDENVMWIFWDKSPDFYYGLDRISEHMRGAG